MNVAPTFGFVELSFSSGVVRIPVRNEPYRRERSKEGFYSPADFLLAIRDHKFKGWADYRKRYKCDPMIPCSPHHWYGSEIGKQASRIFKAYRKRKAKKMIANPNPKRFRVVKYKTLTEVRKAVKKLGINSWDEYDLRYREDPKLPSRRKLFKDRDQKGSRVFGRWRITKKRAQYYSHWRGASSAVFKLGVWTTQDYQKSHNKDPRLPSNPWTFYSDYPGHDIFFQRS